MEAVLRRLLPAGWAFALSAAMAFNLYFWLNDWNWYAEINGRKEVMNTSPLPSRFAESAVVALFVGGIVAPL